MKTVWVVMIEGYYGKEIVSIHKTAEGAEKAANKTTSFSWISDYDVED